MKLRSFHKFNLAILASLLSTITFANTDNLVLNKRSCAENPSLQKERSKELIKIAKQDQAERNLFSKITPANMIIMAKNDLKRRKRVAEIFAEGCLKSSLDYEIAALVFQHGDVPDHYYQAYLFAQRANKMSKDSNNDLALLAIDRYLVSLGQKQLFASQYFSSDVQSNRCYCMQPVEPSFSDKERISHGGRPLNESYKLLVSYNKMNGCNAKPVECKTELKPTVQGSVPGVW